LCRQNAIFGFGITFIIIFDVIIIIIIIIIMIKAENIMQQPSVLLLRYCIFVWLFEAYLLSTFVTFTRSDTIE